VKLSLEGHNEIRIATGFHAHRFFFQPKFWAKSNARGNSWTGVSLGSPLKFPSDFPIQRSGWMDVPLKIFGNDDESELKRDLN
jgi:hypothetical protein